MITKKDKDLLASQIGFLISMADTEALLPEKRRQQMAASLAGFVCHATIKYIAGQKQHGGDIVDRDLDNEIRNEITDLMWYQSAKLWRK